MIDIFKKYSDFYTCKFSEIPRPQPSDFVMEYFNNQKDLFFVDVGAHDGITWSNSLTLEENLDWSGICIEANPKVFEQLYKHRDAECLNYGVYNEDGELTFWNISGYAEMLSGFESSYDPRHIQRIHNEISSRGGSIEKIKIETKTLNTLLRDRETPIRHIDYLSIDTEGSELEILQGLNLNKINITLISVENNGYNDLVKKYLADFNYKKFTKICGDDFYIKDE
jgi:FkbM family methyltransferase